jgi:hypothetical protein
MCGFFLPWFFFFFAFVLFCFFLFASTKKEEKFNVIFRDGKIAPVLTHARLNIAQTPKIKTE